MLQQHFCFTFLHQAAGMTGAAAEKSPITFLTRLVYTVLFVAGFCYYDTLQKGVDSLYSYLHQTWVFNSVYFETWWTTLCYPVILAFPRAMAEIRYFDQYKLDKDLKWQTVRWPVLLWEGIEYSTPLLILDTIIVKKYSGVDPLEWNTRKADWIQRTRALPAHPPTVAQILVQLVGSFVIYDLLFFLVHYAGHKNLWLYRHFHASHHDHDQIHSRVTNQLAVPERIALVLCANNALKIMGSHVLTRMLFVPLFLAWLTENHCGYSFPWTLDKVVPFGLVGGSPAHYQHHCQGERNYQPFFTYIDRYALSKKKQS